MLSSISCFTIVSLLTISSRITESNALSFNSNSRNEIIRHNDSSSSSSSSSSSNSNSKKNNIVYSNIQLKPSYIQTERLTQSYQQTLLNKLFSSVPVREKAIDDISLSFGHFEDEDETESSVIGVGNSVTGGEGEGSVQKRKEAQTSGNGLTLLVGRSASGKSTLLRILALMEEPKSGQVFFNSKKYMFQEKEWQQYKGDDNSNGDHDINENIAIAKPIIIDSKPDCFDTKSSVFQRIIESIPDLNGDGDYEIDSIQNKLKENIVHEFSNILGFTTDQLHSSSPSDLTPSQQYLFGIACSCVESSFSDTNINKDNASIVIPCPILLLDELLDTETSDVANKVGQGLLNLTKRGGIVIAATHRPQYLKNVAQRVITLSSGKVLTVEHCKL